MTSFNLGPGSLYYSEPDSREAEAAARAERVEALAEKLFVAWVGRGGGFAHPMSEGVRSQVRDAASMARECATIFVGGGAT